MALTITQAVAASYNTVLNDSRKPTNQWAENAAMRYFEKLGFIKRMGLGPQIEVTLDYRKNPGSGFLANDMDPVSLAKTEVLTAAVYDIAEVSTPVVWSKKDEATNPTENQKVAFTASLLQNGFDSHDDDIEQAIMAATTEGFLGLQTLVPTTGQGTPGGIDASTETFWRNPADTYLADGSDLEAILETVWLSATKGSGSALTPKLLLTGQEACALFTGTQVSLQRFSNTSTVDASFTNIMFKSAPMIYSQYGSTKIYGISPKSLRLCVSKQMFRDKGETKELEQPNAYGFKIYTALQMVTNNKSRLFVVDEA